MSLMAARVLVIEGEQRLQKLLAGYLSQHEIAVSCCTELAGALSTLAREPFDAVLLSSMLPGMDGLLAVERIRAAYRAPIIILKAEDDHRDILPALAQGADDFIKSPFDPQDLLARLKLALARAKPASPSKLSIGDLGVDLAARKLTVGGKPVQLTGIEFDLLVTLVRHAGEVVTREALLSESGRGDVVVGERTVDVHISHLRRKLGEKPGQGRRIRAIRGVGYVLTVEG